MSVAIPGAGEITALLNTASTTVRQIDNWVVTVDGVMMDPAEAAQIGAKLATAPPSKEQKAELAVQMVKKLHPAMKADTAQNAAQLAVDLAVAKHHHVEPALERRPNNHLRED